MASGEFGVEKRKKEEINKTQIKAKHETRRCSLFTSRAFAAYRLTKIDAWRIVHTICNKLWKSKRANEKIIIERTKRIFVHLSKFSCKWICDHTQIFDSIHIYLVR